MEIAIIILALLLLILSYLLFQSGNTSRFSSGATRNAKTKQ